MTANERQVGGDHYKASIEHWDFVQMHDIPYMEAQIIKYVMRWRKKNGVQDLEKALHFLEKLIEQNTEQNPYRVAEERRSYVGGRDDDTIVTYNDGREPETVGDILRGQRKQRATGRQEQTILDLIEVTEHLMVQLPGIPPMEVYDAMERLKNYRVQYFKEPCDARSKNRGNARRTDGNVRDCTPPAPDIH